MLTHAPLQLADVVAQVARPEAGAVDLFLGVVRSPSDGRVVTLLEYEAYHAMALAEMGRIVDEVAAELGDVRLAAAHRLGALAVGEVAVICAASAPHRAEAFVACRRLIDELKRRVPIFKREHRPDGAHWVGWEDARCEHSTAGDGGQ